ncbi:MAG: AlpA family phage regulatory protein [Rhodobacter sp.]|nr:AlpA family phage regulatory protein [Rhodobacter sp.]
MTNVELMTRQEVEALLGMGRSTLYRLMRSGDFPLPIKIGPRSVRWRRSDVNDHLSACPLATGDLAATDADCQAQERADAASA